MADYQWVLPRISVGAALNATDIPNMVAEGVGYIVDATQHDDGAFNHPEVDVLYLNIADDGQPKKEIFLNVVAPWFEARWFSTPAKRWNFHCDAGINRGPSTCFFALLLLGFSASDAENFVRHARPQVGLAYKADAMAAARDLGFLVS